MNKKFFEVDEIGKVSAFGFGFIGFSSERKYLNRGFAAGSRVLKVFKGLPGFSDTEVLNVVLSDCVTESDLHQIFEYVKKFNFSSTVGLKLYAPLNRYRVRKSVDEVIVC